MAMNLSGSFVNDTTPATGNMDGVPHFGIQGPPGPQGDPGGYYVPAIEQTGENELEVSFFPSLPDMPYVAPVKVTVTLDPDSGGNAENGEDGFSPIAKVEQTATGAIISITDKDGTTTATITNGKDGKDGVDGQDGYTPKKGIDYFDGQPGKNGADGAPGEKGDKGDKGDTGATGADGKDGADGYSPVRGKDYWTDADKLEIKSYVDEAILGGEW